MKIFNQLDQPIVKKHIAITLLGSVFGLLLYYYFQASYVTENTPSSATTILLSAFCGIVVAYCTYFISRRLDFIAPWKNQLANRFLLGILLTFGTALIIIFSFAMLCKNAFSIEFTDTYESTLIKLSILLFMAMLIYNIIYFALYSYYSYAKFQIEAITYERKQIDLQLKALKSQLSSHFLFNNLNTISSLIYKDVQSAEHYVRRLANIYNYTLNSYNSKLVTLSEELGFVRSYVMLIETRFGKSFQYTIDVPERFLTSKIPPLTLQMLVENTVKHNQMNEDHVLEVDIKLRNEHITVRNNITTPPNNVTSFNIGLKNIEARYKLLSNSKIEIEKTSHFEVKIPLIN